MVVVYTYTIKETSMFKPVELSSLPSPLVGHFYIWQIKAAVCNVGFKKASASSPKGKAALLWLAASCLGGSSIPLPLPISRARGCVRQLHAAADIRGFKKKWLFRLETAVAA